MSSKKIYKYTLSQVPGSTTLELPKGFQILGLKLQAQETVLYAMVDTENEPQKIAIDSVMTGQEYNLSGVYIDTVLYGSSGSFVLHVFWRYL